ncbi:low affinity immunoglobulin gamma Fc region receptor II-like [Ammospiza maritima maritima]
MAGKVALLLWAQTLGLAGAQTTQLLVEPPWRPAVLWDRVTLTCQGSGTASATIWYKDGQRLWRQGSDHFKPKTKGTYQCCRPGTGHSLPVSVSEDWLVLQVPVKALVEGDTVKLRCRGWRNNTVTSVSFYHEEKKLQELRDGTELSLSPLQLHHSGRYSCKGSVDYWGWKESAPVPVTVTVHVAAGVGGALLFLLLLVGVIVAWHQWHRVVPRKQQERALPDPPAPPEEGQVLYTHVVDPQVTYAGLQGPQGRPPEPGDIYRNVL